MFVREGLGYQLSICNHVDILENSGRAFRSFFQGWKQSCILSRIVIIQSPTTRFFHFTITLLLNFVSISSMWIPIVSGSLSSPAQMMLSPFVVRMWRCSLCLWYCWYFSYSLFDICSMQNFLYLRVRHSQIVKLYQSLCFLS